MRITRYALVAFVAMTTSVSAAAQRKPAANRLASLDAYVATVMKDWKVPGIAIAIVKDDSVVLAKGYGVQKLGDPTPVNELTIFAIGSASKAFTAALVAMAVDQGKMRFDDPVTKHLPGFQLYDTYASRDLTIRDALSHRSGLARGDMAWYAAGLSREEILQRVRYLKPSWGFRGLFGYQNIMYLAAGEASAKAQGMSWDDQIKQRIFGPLGMSSSSTSTNALTGRPNVATPHIELENVLQVIPWKNIDNIAPAGSINSNVVDMARWVRFQLNQGKVGDKQLITAGNMADMWQPNTPIRLEGPLAGYLSPGGNLSAYGMGWFLQDFSGRLAVHHGGNIDGFSAVVAMLPKERLGIVVLTNKDGTPAPQTIFPYIYDLYTADTPRNFSADYLKLLATMQGQVAQAESALVKSRVQGTSPSMALGKYAGIYRDSMYGDVKVTEDAGKLQFAFGIMKGAMDHWHYDTFRAVMEPARFGKMQASFTLDASGKPAELKLESMPEATFRLSPPPADTRAAVTLSADQLKALTGTFVAEGAPIELEVQLVGDALKLTVPGQPAYTLVAVTPSRFRLTGPPGMPDGFYFQYEMTAGKVAGATLEQPAPQPALKVRKKGM